MNILTAHQYSSNNHKSLLKSKHCGCFYCLRIFSPEKITECIDTNDQTALCPYCSVDSLLGDVDVKFDEDFLKQMHNEWF